MLAPTYMPLLRGKMNELMLLQIVLPLVQRAPVVPIIEPVRAKTDKLEKLIDYYVEFRAPLGVIINPAVGDFSQSALPLQLRVARKLCLIPQVFPVVRLGTKGVEFSSIVNADALAVLEDSSPCPETRSIVSNFIERITLQITGPESASQVQHNPLPCKRILLRNGFQKRRTVDYPEDEEFHSGPFYLNQNKHSGFSDYLIVGQNYQDGGGLPHAVAIHITYWTPQHELRVHHYVSDTNDGPEDPGGKFAEALSKLMADLALETYPILETSAIRKLRGLHEAGHFPGLGHIKLLTMLHHLETICSRISRTTSRNAEAQA